MDDIHYDILEKIISKLDLMDAINFLYSSKKNYDLYKNYDEKYGINKISNKIIGGFSNFFNINGNKFKNKHGICDDFIKIYEVFKNNKSINNIDILIYIIENDMSDELFDAFCSKCRYVLQTNIEPLPSKNTFVNIIDILNNKQYYFKEHTKNIICKSDMNYMLIYADIKKLDIILKKFNIDNSTILYCIKTILKNGNNNSICNIKIKKYIDYIFMKYCFKDMTSLNKFYFNTIYALLYKNNQMSLVRYFMFKIFKYNCKEILNNDLVINIMTHDHNLEHINLEHFNLEHYNF